MMRVAAAVVLVAAVAADSVVARPYAQTAPAAAPALSTEAQLTFLQSARIVSTRPIGRGTTGALRVALSDGTLTHDAAFQAIAIEPKFDGKKRAGEIRFADHYRYNLAAWRLSVLLGLEHMMPATVERRVEGRTGALAWWVDDVAMDEAEREAKKAQPPSALQFSRQRGQMSIFAELVRDMDRNKGNIVYTKDWRVIMLDFTRAFRLDAALRRPDELLSCDRGLFTAMKGLTREAMARAMDAALRDDEIRGVLARRDLLVRHFEQLIASRGEAAVLY